MLNKLLISFRLRNPDIHDIIDKIMTSNFTKEELNYLYKVGPLFYTIPSTGNAIKLDYRKDFCNACVIEIQYNSQYCIPNEKDLIKYLPEVKIAIQECKSRLPELILEYNSRKQLQQEMQQEQSQCIKKLWKMVK
jgi:hypothetical protein